MRIPKYSYVIIIRNMVTEIHLLALTVSYSPIFTNKTGNYLRKNNASFLCMDIHISRDFMRHFRIENNQLLIFPLTFATCDEIFIEFFTNHGKNPLKCFVRSFLLCGYVQHISAFRFYKNLIFFL